MAWNSHPVKATGVKLRCPAPSGTEAIPGGPSRLRRAGGAAHPRAAHGRAGFFGSTDSVPHAWPVTLLAAPRASPACRQQGTRPRRVPSPRPGSAQPVQLPKPAGTTRSASDGARRRAGAPEGWGGAAGGGGGGRPRHAQGTRCPRRPRHPPPRLAARASSPSRCSVRNAPLRPPVPAPHEPPGAGYALPGTHLLTSPGPRPRCTPPPPSPAARTRGATPAHARRRHPPQRTCPALAAYAGARPRCERSPPSPPHSPRC